MAVREPASLPEDPAARQRMRAETPPAHYWRRWVQDAEGNAAEAEAAPKAKAPAAGRAAASVAAQEPQATADDSPYRILIVEDDRTQALFAQSVLHGAGMKAEVQMQPDGVIDAIGRFDPDLILMDLHMPGLDGMRLTTLIRQQLTSQQTQNAQTAVDNNAKKDCLSQTTCRGPYAMADCKGYKAPKTATTGSSTGTSTG